MKAMTCYAVGTMGTGSSVGRMNRLVKYGLQFFDTCGVWREQVEAIANGGDNACLDEEGIVMNSQVRVS